MTHGLLASLRVAALVLGLGAACTGDLPGGAVDPYPAPETRLTDNNPQSPTFLEERSLEEARGSVLLMYFASFT